MTAGSLNISQFSSAFQEVEKVIQTNSRTFYFATNLLPKKERQAIRSLYAFCRTADDLVDNHSATRQELDRWHLKVQRPSDEQSDAILYCWAKTREAYGIDPRYQAELIEGVAADTITRQYETWQELERYCYLVASTVGLLSTPIIGLARGVDFETAKPYAVKLGIALQLTNILRDVGEDAANGRVYLPREDLERFHLTAEDILNGVYDQRYIEMMRFEIRRARRLYLEALPGIAMLSASGRTAVGVAALLYRAILDEIEAIRYQTHIQRAYVSGKKKLAYLPRFLWQILRLKPMSGV